MAEFMRGMDIDPMMIQTSILEAPIKGARTLTDEQLQSQADIARQHTVEVDYHAVRGTCGDERERVGLADGSDIVEPRPSAFGGPNIYGLYMAELTGYFGDQQTSGEERLEHVTRLINSADIKSGGHQKCAANAGFATVLAKIGEAPTAFRDYAKQNMGDAYNDNAMSLVFSYAQKAAESGAYVEWDETVLPRVLEKVGDNPGEAIEVLADVPHEGLSLVRSDANNKTVDQTAVHHAGNGDSFVNDEQYCALIEAAVASGSNAVEASTLARHAREALLAAIAGAVPNEEINQINQTI